MGAPRPPAEPFAKKPWVVLEYKDRGKGQWYRFAIVDGFNLWDAGPDGLARSISWLVPDLDDASFDLSRAVKL